MKDLAFFRDKRVLLTGHTGFKGSWLSRILIDAGAKLTGFSLEPPTNPSIFGLCGMQSEMDSVIGDIRDFELLKKTFERTQPEIVIHLAAQPIVRESYRSPRETYETNVLGTVNLLECIRNTPGVHSVLNVTTDKVYENREWAWGYRESDPLDGYDPYSNSKSCSELVTHSYTKSFLAQEGIAVSTARAGNVIGGGDFAADRIIPDCFRSALAKEPIIIRNPFSTRPYQHVLEPLFAYLMIVQGQWENIKLADCYNVGPQDEDCVNTGRLADMFCEHWGEGIGWVNKSDNGPHEAGFLKLDCSKLRSVFGWRPAWSIDEAVGRSTDWYKTYAELLKSNASAEEASKALKECMRAQIDRYLCSLQ